jgi:hypothetical protein
LLPALVKRELSSLRYCLSLQHKQSNISKNVIGTTPPVSAGGVVFLVLEDNITRKFPEGDVVYYVEEKYLVSKFWGD